MNDQNIISEIRKKIDIVDLIGEYLPLSQKGKNFFGICPFHNDNNPSMSVSREKQIYKCFSCGASGNIFTFVSEYENISFKEALSLLASKVGIALGNTKNYEKANTNEKYYEIYDLALKFYQNNINTTSGTKAREYLRTRKLDSEIIKRFNIGYSLDEDKKLLELLSKKGYSYKDLVDIGLVTDNHDVYIDRIMFPLHDVSGKVVGFSGRIYGDSKKNKYVNTKETVIFKKGHCLYNYHIAKESSRKEGYVLVMEGFMDVIRASTIGFTNSVALMGTALTNEQLTLIKKLSQNIILCFDGDEAGQHATMNVGKQLQDIGITCKVIVLKDNDDPDTYILNSGEEAFKHLVDTAINFNDYKIENLKNGVNFSSDMELATYVDNVLKEASVIKDEIRREIILKKLAIECNLSYNTLEKRLTEYAGKKKIETPIVQKPDKKSTRYEKAIDALFYAMLSDAKVIDICKRENVCFVFEKNRHLYNEILYFYDTYGDISLADMYTYLAFKEELLALLNDINKVDDYDCSMAAVEDYIQVIKDYNKKQEIKRLNESMKKENNLLEQAKIAEKIRLIKIGENNHG